MYALGSVSLTYIFHFPPPQALLHLLADVYQRDNPAYHALCVRLCPLRLGQSHNPGPGAEDQPRLGGGQEERHGERVGGPQSRGTGPPGGQVRPLHEEGQAGVHGH